MPAPAESTKTHARLAAAQAAPHQPDAPADSPDLPSPERGTPDAPKSDLPTLAYRRVASEQVRFLAPKAFKPETPRPTLIQPRRSEVRRSTAPAPEAALAPSFNVAPAPSGPEMPVAASPARPASRAESSLQPASAPAAFASATMEMPVVRMPELAPPAPAVPIQLPTMREPVQPVRQPDIPTRPEASKPLVVSAATNTVQRLWDEHSPPASAPGGGSNASNRESSAGESALDLDQLAEDVLPIVKRLIEIESERSSGYLG
jgi:hypothetical protein